MWAVYHVGYIPGRSDRSGNKKPPNFCGIARLEHAERWVKEEQDCYILATFADHDDAVEYCKANGLDYTD